MLIGLNGKLKAGKDTTFEVIQELYPDAERVSFADTLKDSAAASLNMSRGLLEYLKGAEDIHFEIPKMSIMSSSLPSDVKAELSHWKLNMRQYLQLYGTEAHRDIFGDDFWIDMALPKNLDHSNKILVVTDMRFPNEIERVRELGGITVKVVRDARTLHGNHPSEQDVDHLVDYFLDNTGTLANLQTNVNDLLQKIGLNNQVRV